MQGVILAAGKGSRLHPITLARSKAKAHQIKCLSNEKQMGLAFILFADDNQDAYPATSNWDNFGGTLGKSDAYGGFTAESNRPLNRYVGNVEVFHCPGDKGDSLWPQFKTAWDLSGNSYRTQWGYNSFRILHVTGDSSSADARTRPITTAVINRRPANKIILGENPFPGNRLSADAKSVWHNFKGQRGYNMCFGDGHAEFYKFPKEMENPAIAVFTYSPSEYSYPDANFAWW